LDDFGLKFDNNYLIQCKSDIASGQKAVDKFMKLDNPPDAIFSSSDFLALGAIQRLKHYDIKIPQEFCVVGFSNEPFTKFMELSISSVDQAPLQMGKTTAKVFLEQVKDSKVKIEKKVVLSPTLKVRKSSNRS
jgi:LacI family transcriptional regulator